jgi:hypothetical protein
MDTQLGNIINRTYGLLNTIPIFHRFARSAGETIPFRFIEVVDKMERLTSSGQIQCIDGIETVRWYDQVLEDACPSLSGAHLQCGHTPHFKGPKPGSHRS